MKYILLIIILSNFASDAQIISSVAGNGSNSYCCDGSLATNASFSQEIGVAIDKHNNLFIADFHNNRIRKVDAITGIISTIAGTGVAGFSGDGGMADTAELNWPGYIAFDYIGNLYINDAYNHRIRKIDTFGIITTYAGTGSTGGSGDGGAANGL